MKIWPIDNQTWQIEYKTQLIDELLVEILKSHISRRYGLLIQQRTDLITCQNLRMVLNAQISKMSSAVIPVVILVSSKLDFTKKIHLQRDPLTLCLFSTFARTAHLYMNEYIWHINEKYI